MERLMKRLRTLLYDLPMTPEEEERVEKLHQESLQNQPQKEQMNAPFDPLLEDLDLLQDLDSQIPGCDNPPPKYPTWWHSVPPKTSE